MAGITQHRLFGGGAWDTSRSPPPPQARSLASGGDVREFGVGFHRQQRSPSPELRENRPSAPYTWEPNASAGGQGAGYPTLRNCASAAQLSPDSFLGSRKKRNDRPVSSIANVLSPRPLPRGDRAGLANNSSSRALLWAGTRAKQDNVTNYGVAKEAPSSAAAGFELTASSPRVDVERWGVRDPIRWGQERVEADDPSMLAHTRQDGCIMVGRKKGVRPPKDGSENQCVNNAAVAAPRMAGRPSPRATLGVQNEGRIRSGESGLIGHFGGQQAGRGPFQPIYSPGKDGQFVPPGRTSTKKLFGFDQKRESLHGWRGISDMDHAMGISPPRNLGPQATQVAQGGPGGASPRLAGASGPTTNRAWDYDAHKPSMVQLHPEAHETAAAVSDPPEPILMSEENFERQPGPWRHNLPRRFLADLDMDFTYRNREIATERAGRFVWRP